MRGRAGKIGFDGLAAARRALLASTVSVSLTVGGCAVGPQYGGPPSTQMADFHNKPAIESRQAGLAPPPVETWWTGFRDPELTRIVDRALAQNLDLAAALARVEQARAAAREAGAQL